MSNPHDNQISDKNLLRPVAIAKNLSLTGYFGLILLFPVWYLLWYPSSGSLNTYLMLIWMFPLIFPLKGLIKGRPYTFAWSGFLAILYITHGLTCVVTHPQEMPAIILELIFSSLFLFGGMYYVRWRSKL